MFQSNNPTLRNQAFAPAQTWDDAVSAGTVGGVATRERSTTMTLQGTVWKSLTLLTICAVVAIFGWNMILSNRSLFLPIWAIGGISGFVIGLILFFRPQLSPFLAPVYAVAEGAFLAGASIAWATYAASGSKGGGTLASIGTGVVLQAAVLTFGIAACMFIAYGTRLIRPSKKVVAGIFAATGGVIIFSFVMFLISMFAPGTTMGLWQSPIGLVIAGVIVVIAAANLVVDFAFVENGVENKAPKYMEWYAGYALLVTLVWLYISILRLLALLKRE